MKTISLLFFISIFVNSMFGDEVKSVSVMEGDSVTLHTHFTDTEAEDVTIVWTFGPQKSTIAKINREPKGNKISIFDDVLDGRFRDRLQMNNQTGDLTIKDITTQHTGVYEVEITVRSKIIQKSFNVNGVINPESDQLKSVSVKDADSVTLLTDVHYFKTYDRIQWRFKGIRIAQFNKSASKISEDERFRDKLQLDVQTGSLQIKNIRTDLSGLYEVDLTSISSSYTIHQPFTVTVSGEVKPVSVKKGDPVTIYTYVPDIKSYDQILLIFGCDDKRIAEVNKQNKKFTLYGRIRDRLKLNDQTGDLTITDVRYEDAGDYELKISSRRRTIQRRFRVNVSDRGLSPGAVAGISVIFILLAAAVGGAAAGVIYYRRKFAKAKQQLEVDEGESVHLKTCELKTSEVGELKTSIVDEGKSVHLKTGQLEPSEVAGGQSVHLQTGELELTEVAGGQSVHLQTGELKPSEVAGGQSVNLKTGELKTSEVDEGQSVHLKTEVDDIKRDEKREWRSGETEINPANNIFSRSDGDDKGGFKEKMEKVPVNEGKSYTLKNTLTEIRRDDVIEWRFKETLIAKINPANNIFSTSDGDDDEFRDKLKLNHQTGDLNINDIREKHAGDYTLKIIRDRETLCKRFIVFVRCETLRVDEGESVNLKTEVNNIKRVDLIEWRFGETLIAELSPGNMFLRTSYKDKSLFRDKLKLNHQTGDLNIRDISEEHDGVYKLKIIRDGETSNKRFSVSVTASKKGDSVRKWGREKIQ